ncbi:MAG: hypothetical protein JSS62_05945 [Verrucomicrobia bacterium]|nr:hypothetical protein [Verrucomicrobiota bacterium]MBS0647109.1 hypothetical protein [Verrucomicrobiota bacterium]
MGLIFVLIAALLAALSNLLLRISVGVGGSSKGYLAIQVMVSCLVMILLNPIRMQDFSIYVPAVALGCVGGFILGVFFWGLGKTLEKGPAGLSIAVLNASSIMPALVLAVCFGEAFGHVLTRFHGMGFILVTVGIFWAGWTSEYNPHKRQWAIFALLMFACHALYLIFLQWWAMVLNPELSLTKLLPFHINTTHIQWFMPAIFFVAGLFQWIVFIKQEKRFPVRHELMYGLIGGVATGICSYFLILAPQISAPWENALLFPVFTVGVLVFCNLWAVRLYKEKVNWKACSLCIVGLLLGMMR